MWWAVVWLRPYSTFITITKDLAKFGAWHYGESNGNGMLWIWPSNHWYTYLLVNYIIHRCKLFWLLYMWWAVIWLCPYSTVITIALPKFGGECVDFWHVSYCYVMIGSSHSHPLNTHTKSTSYIYKALDILYMRWAAIWLCPYSTIITIALAKFGVRW